jgi:hypothetical protein
MKEMPENIEKLVLPADDCDILSGYEQIANWRGISIGAARAQANAGDIPVWRVKGRNVVYAFKSEITEHMRGLARKYRERASAREVGDCSEWGKRTVRGSWWRGARGISVRLQL